MSHPARTSLLDLLKMGALTASEQDSNSLVPKILNSNFPVVAQDISVKRDDPVGSLPDEILSTVLQHVVGCPQARRGGPLGGLLACRSVCRRWRMVCIEDAIIAAAATQLSGHVRLQKLLCASADEAMLVPYGRALTLDEAMLVLGAMRAAPEGPFERRLARKALRKRAVLPYPSPVLNAVRRRARLIESSRSKRNRLPLLRSYDEDAADWYGWWTPEVAMRGAMA
eukprot:132239-Prymnesium_polylepis.1